MFKACCICGNGEITERHHIVPKSKGGSNGEENIIIVCPNCHGLIHRGKYSEGDLLAFKKTPKIRGDFTLAKLESMRRFSPGDRL